ncbi:hypothetical protein TNCV_41741, partial [Trichonephila clavipes]
MPVRWQSMMISCDTTPDDSADVVGSKADVLKATVSVNPVSAKHREMVDSTMGGSEGAVNFLTIVQLLLGASDFLKKSVSMRATSNSSRSMIW